MFGKTYGTEAVTNEILEEIENKKLLEIKLDAHETEF
jgi:hypothetical protein